MFTKTKQTKLEEALLIYIHNIGSKILINVYAFYAVNTFYKQIKALMFKLKTVNVCSFVGLVFKIMNRWFCCFQ